MNKNKNFNGDKLRSARLYRNKSIDLLSKETNIKKDHLKNLEDNKELPNLEEILNLSNILKFPREYFDRMSKINVNIEKVYFNSKILDGNDLSDCTKDELSYLEKILITNKIYNFIGQYISFPKLNLPLINKGESIESIAKSVRKYWNLDDTPIYNMLNLLESNGIIISTINTGKNSIKSFSVKHKSYDNEKYTIVLGNDKKSITRRNYELACEVGKILLEDVVKANQFAEAFLLPEVSLLGNLGNTAEIEDYIDLKAMWIVPISTLISRLYDLGQISGRKYDYLKKEMKKLGWSKKEPLDNAKATNPILSKTALDLIIENNIMTKSSFIKYLSEDGVPLYQEDIEELLGLKKGKLSSKYEVEEDKVVNKDIKVINFKR